MSERTLPKPPDDDGWDAVTPEPDRAPGVRSSVGKGEPRIPLRSLETEMALPDEPIPWVWSARLLVAPGRPTIVAAYGGGAKTWLVLAMGLSVATGAPFVGNRPARIGRVIHLSYEASARSTRRRLRRLVRGLVVTDLSRYAYATQEDLMVWLTTEGVEDQLLSLCEGVTLLTIDSLAVGAIGLDENSPAMAAPMIMLGRVSAATGCAIVVIAHDRKSQPHDGPPGERLRGSSAIHAACDAIWSLSRAADSSIIMTASKASEARIPAGYVVRVEDTEDGGIVVTHADLPDVVARVGKDDAARAAKDDALDTLVLAFVAENPGASGRTVRAGVTGSDARIGTALDRLTLHKRLAATPGGPGKATTYCLPSDPEPVSQPEEVAP